MLFTLNYIWVEVDALNSIDIMKMEHQNILRMLEVVRRYCLRVLKHEPVDYKDFYKIIDFVRNYADKHHHGKEETLLFNRMMDELGSLADKLVRHGMLVEHDLGRLYMSELEEALKKLESGDEDAKLDIIASAMGYVNLLKRHIDKEDNVIYKFAENNLKKDTLKLIDDESANFEKKAEGAEVQYKYLVMLSELEAKVNK
ncbi:Hemerythrin-like domain-containing protein [Lutispora thermophila DSM 19022]|uniref:Hemerythrin-like domain-containing protein n=1 Tax=Lutispora thermophila DSM 19022 TaxID=1122184 RepID=A0A1M6FHZ3_9FIRM|nr:Hemerythrin-like domain-containing protein [Lutispora thermophila DSM 19022]